MTVPDWILQLLIAGAGGYIIKYYISSQDRKYEKILKENKILSDTFMKILEELRSMIQELKLSGATQKTFCIEKHKALDSHLLTIDKQVLDLYQKYNNVITNKYVYKNGRNKTD